MSPLTLRPSRQALPSDQGLLRVLPAEDAGDGSDPVGVDRAARAAQSAIRLGDLRRRRLDPRAHARDRVAPRARNAAEARRAPDLRGGDQGGGGRGRALLLGRGRAPHRGACAAIPSAASARPTSRIRGGYRPDLRSRRRHQGASAISRCPSRPIRRSIPEAASLDADIDALKAKVDCGARPRHHAVLLR